VEITGNASTTHASLQARMRMPANYSTPYGAAPQQSKLHALLDGAGGCRIVGNLRAPERPAEGWQAFGRCAIVVCRHTEDAALGGTKTGQRGAVSSRP
jgi:hypothetical protein